MKRILAYISAAAVLAACNVFGEPEESTPALEAKGIEITISNVTDNSFDVTLTPQGEAAYYSYLVDDSDEVYALDASSLYSVSYSSVAQGIVKYADYKSYSFTVNADPYTDYVVYAVSSSVEGNVGEIATAKVKTTDGVNPEIVDYEADENYYYIQFSEPVQYVSGKSIYAKLYASNYHGKTYNSFMDDSQSLGTTDPSSTKVYIDEDVVVLALPTIPSGAYYGLVIEDGAFVDYAGLPAAGVTTVFTYDKETDGYSVDGLDGRVSPKALACTVDAPEKFSSTNYNEYIPVKMQAVAPFTSGPTANKVTVIRQYVQDSKSYTEESALVAGMHYGATSATDFGIRLAESPNPGDYITISVAEKAFYDVYGNYNKAFTIGPIISVYGYTSDDIIGDYTLNYTWKTYSLSSLLNISASDDASKGDVIISSTIIGIAVSSYADFDVDYGELTLPSMPVVGQYDQYDVVPMLQVGSSFYTNSLGFDVPSSHELEYWYSDYSILLCAFKDGSLVAGIASIAVDSITYSAPASSSASSLSNNLAVSLDQSQIFSGKSIKELRTITK